MLTSTTANGEKVLAALAEKSSGPFSCPECNHETVLHKGLIKVHHFAHKPPVFCEYGKGESEEHRKCKQEIYTELIKDDRLECELEKPLGKVRPDIFIFSKASGKKYAIEVQISALTMEKIIYRTRQYDVLGIYVLWLSPYSDDLERYTYSPKTWEKWVHATYFGRVYYWLHGLTVVPIHFGSHTKWVEESTWYEPGGYEQSAGGYFKRQKRKKKISKGEPVEITKAFKATSRDAWAGGDIIVPKCKILADTQAAWWKADRNTAESNRTIWVTAP